MSEIPCAKCGKPENEFHHLVPKSIGGTDLHGRKYLCFGCHNQLHKYTLPWIWKFVPIENQEKAREYVAKLSLWWIGKK